MTHETKKHTVALIHAIVHNADFADRHLPLIFAVLDYPAREIINFVRFSAYTDVPNLERDFIRSYEDKEGPVPTLLRTYIEAYMDMDPVDATAANEALQRLVVLRTFPNGPILRDRDGTFMPGPAVPIVSGTPTERLVWVALYSLDRQIKYYSEHSLAHQLGTSVASMKSAAESLVERGIVDLIHEPGIGPMISLKEPYTKGSADLLVEYQQNLGSEVTYESYRTTYHRVRRVSEKVESLSEVA